MTDDELAEIGDALVKGYETGDQAIIDRYYTDDTVVWINWDRTEKKRDPENPGGDVERALSIMSDVKVELVLIQRTDSGVVAQLVLRAKLRQTGAPIELHNCMVIRLDNGKFARVDEYVDPNMLLQVPGEALAPIEAGRASGSE